MALDLAQVLGAGDDFLARVAALLEVEAADLLVIDHLRDELVLGGSDHARIACGNLAQAPGIKAGRRGAGCRLAPGGAGRCGVSDQQEAPGSESEQGAAIDGDAAANLRCGAGQRGGQRCSVVAGDA